ncbi:DUF6414 family protein [Acinetobacter sp. Tol 5]|uniref:DUF6414 family protein n=1 Tax=Acinetobacter sp. (strain Tol 5) TaxID=710648 RepID=UPI001C78EED3|nr:hypothetical protein [Acinetobacter sp. Tol 5]BCX74796.1 hypothetical protein TOL5_29960 [Acinetobacter sp. Tol 5]
MEQESQSIESIFDFIYLDNTKIRSFYAQLTGNGAITSRKNTSSTSDDSTAEFSGSIPTVATAKSTFKNIAGLGSEDIFDASVTMPREMIDKLDELGFVNRVIDPDNLGNLLLVEGRLSIVDVSVIKGFVEPSIDFMKSSMPNLTSAHKKKKEEFSKITQPMLQFVREVPYALEGKLLVDTGGKDSKGIPLCDEIWMTLSRSEMINNAHDINFKHGEFMSGKWYVLGVLDAIPYDDGFTYHTEKNELRNLISQTTNMLKEQFGRPNNAFGMTPVAIFRVLRSSKS